MHLTSGYESLPSIRGPCIKHLNNQIASALLRTNKDCID